MSTQSIFNEENLPTSEVLAKHFVEDSVNLIKYLRFEIGCICHEDMREVLRAQRMICGDLCYINNCDKLALRETIITKGIRNIQEL